MSDDDSGWREDGYDEEQRKIWLTEKQKNFEYMQTILKGFGSGGRTMSDEIKETANKDKRTLKTLK